MSDLKYYKILTKGGHFGNGRCRDLLFYSCATDVISAMNKARNMRGVKHHAIDCIIKCEEISKEEYTAWRASGKSAYDTYRQYIEERTIER